MPKAPFVVTASSGPQAGAHIVATVTRTVGKTAVTLPAALVPALEPGDVVSVDFPDYRRPPSRVNYHVNVAFVTETAPQHWLFGRSGPVDQLFSNRARHGAKSHGPPSPAIRFTYGTGNARGIPIFFIIPEDAKTRGVDGVRDYVDAHPSDFVAMSESTNDAIDQYGFLRDFLTSLGSGSIDPVSSRQRIETLAQSAGVPPAAIDACYVPGATPGAVDDCIQQAVNGVVYQTNFNAPTQGQFLGGLAGAANPAALAPYIASLLTVWRIFVRTGHLEYEYLPTTVTLADASMAHRDELLMGPKVPTIRPPGAYSDVLFFTIGDPRASESAPAIANAAPAGGECARTNRFDLPLGFDHLSRYVHDAALVVTPDGRPAYRIALDPRTLSNPIVDRAQFGASADGAYSVSLTGRFGFDPIAQPVAPTMRLAFPNDAPWTIAAAPHHLPVAGQTLDLIASSGSAACLSGAELQIGSAPPIALDAKPLDARRVELRASLADVPAGPAVIRLYEDDPPSGRTFATSQAVAIRQPPARIDAKSAVAALGDDVIALTGTALQQVRGVRVNGGDYAKVAGATATTACFDGPPLAGAGLAIGEQLPAQLLTGDGSPGQVFPLTLAAPRPVLAPPPDPPGEPRVQLSTTPLAITLHLASGKLPRQIDVRVRQADAAPATCDGLRPDPAAVTLPAADVRPLSADSVGVSFRADVLHDRAFGALQLRVVDAAGGGRSNWVTLPGTFVRAPEVTSIVCPAGENASCRLYGSDLASIAAVQSADGTSAAPGFDCPATDKGLACVYVPHLPHYVLRLVDGAALEPLPDGLIQTASR